MRISFAAMIASLIVLVIVDAAGANANVSIAATSVLTALWFAHVIARALRSLPPKSEEIDARRVALRSFGRALVGAAAVSIIFVTSLNTAEAASCGQSCSKSNSNCPSGCICWWELGKCAKLN
jgi:dipeptide/tripeptide permease